MQEETLSRYKPKEITMVSLNDLRRAFYGAGSKGSIADAEYRQLLALYGQDTPAGQSGVGVSLSDLAYAQRVNQVYNPNGLSSWRGALTGGRNNVLLLGDSNTAWSDDYVTPAQHWVNQFRTDILALTGQAGGGPGFRHMRNPDEWVPTGAWLFHDTGINSVDIGPVGSTAYAPSNSDIMTWTAPGSTPAHDRFDLYGIDDDLLEIQGEYSLNGGAFTATTWVMTGDTGVKLVKQSIVTAITTTLQVRGGGGPFTALYAGAAFYNGTTGLVVHNLARGGARVSDMAGLTSMNGRLALIDDLQPKLSIIWSGGAELLDGTGGPFDSIIQLPLDTYYTKLKAIVDKCRLYGDVLIVSSMAVGEPNPITVNPALRPNTVFDFESKAKQVASETDSAWFSWRNELGTWDQVNARGRMLDYAHFNAAGHVVVAKVLNRILTDLS